MSQARLELFESDLIVGNNSLYLLRLRDLSWMKVARTVHGPDVGT